MKISLITPAGKRSRDGNRTTAIRWAKILRDLGHQVNVATDYDGARADMMIALHAWRTAAASHRFHELYPDRPLIVTLTGTDINEFIHSHPETTLKSMEIADRLVCLHDLARDAVPKRFHRKLRVIHQSCLPLAAPRKPAKRHFEVCVIGHMRTVKDPLRAAYAVRHVPPESRLRVTQLGKAHTDAWAKKARAEEARNPRFRWLGDVPFGQVRREFVKTHVMVISSLAEGGANVVSEAMVAGVPVIASNIPGNLGLLGADYPGVFPARDTKALRDMLLRAEIDPKFLSDLTRRCKARAKLFRPEQERSAWRRLIKEITA